MPAAITHYLFCQRVLENLQKQDPTFTVETDAFLWGAQGPDFFFTHRFLPWQHGESLEPLGEKLHREKPSKILDAMRNYQEQSENPRVAASYIYGFATHYCADSRCHPYVNAGAALLLPERQGETLATLHNEIESALDVIILRYERGMLPVDFGLKRTVPKNAAVQAEISALYRAVLRELYGTEIIEALLGQALSDCRLIFGLLTDRTSLKKNIVERFERKSGCHSISCHLRGISEGDTFDYANTLLSEWIAKEGEQPRSESFFELYEAAVGDGVLLLQGIQNGDDYAELTQDVPFF